jgi:protein-S-isoprenylcysteine O-methyltransferase Ste14
MNWYLPITIIPGLGMLILSTTSQMLTLSSKIGSLLANKCSTYQHEISERKIKQLGLLTRASALLYLATGCYVLSGILGVIFEAEAIFSIPSVALYIGTILVFVAISVLIIYAFKAVKIRKDQFNNNHKL